MWWRYTTRLAWSIPPARRLCPRRSPLYCRKRIARRTSMKRTNQKGVALIFALIFILVLSITAAALMFLSQSETWASMNYRMMTQARYGAESGLHAAANYLMNNYTLPGGATDPLTAYNVGVSPVTLQAGGTPIALGPTMNGLSPNYPVGTVLTGFNG